MPGHGADRRAGTVPAGYPAQPFGWGFAGKSWDLLMMRLLCKESSADNIYEDFEDARDEIVHYY